MVLHILLIILKNNRDHNCGASRTDTFTSGDSFVCSGQIPHGGVDARRDKRKYRTRARDVALRLIRIDASFEEQELKWRVRIAWKSFGSEPKKEVTHGEENTDREETRKEQKWKAVADYRKWKRVCRRKKNNCGK